MAHHAAAGDRVASLVLTHGVRSHDIRLIGALREGKTLETPNMDEAIEQGIDDKRQEVEDACALLGIQDVRFLEVDDHILTPNADLIRKIADVILDVRPDIIITHHPWEQGGTPTTHTVCASMTLSAIDAAATLLHGSTAPPHRVAQIFFMGVMPACADLDVLAAGSTVWCDVYVDITDVIERKVAALDKMQTQQYAGVYARKRIEAVDGHFGMFMGVAYAEPFSSMRPQVHHRLPLTPHTRRKATETTQDWRDRVCRLLASNVPMEE
jgi:LmbE family N-acetylglucosaminyl deacetylase